MTENRSSLLGDRGELLQPYIRQIKGRLSILLQKVSHFCLVKESNSYSHYRPAFLHGKLWSDWDEFHLFRRRQFRVPQSAALKSSYNFTTNWWSRKSIRNNISNSSAVPNDTCSTRQCSDGIQIVQIKLCVFYYSSYRGVDIQLTP